MQTNPSRRRWKAIAIKVILLAATFAAGWYSPAWMGFYSTKNTAISRSVPAKSAAADLAKAKTDLAKILNTSAGNKHERDLLSWAAGLNARTLKSMFAELAARPDIGKNEKIMSILLGRLVEVDPSAAMTSLKSIQERHLRQSLAVDTFDAWSAKDPAAAFAATSQFFDNGARFVLHEKVLDNMVDQNPQSALAALRYQPSDGFSAWVYNDVFKEWASHDSSTAASAALNLPPNDARDMALQGVASAWAEQDPASALAWAKALPVGKEKTDAINSVIETLSQQDPNSAADIALQFPSGQNRDDLIQGIADNWAQKDPAGALAWADKNLTGQAFDTTAEKSLLQMDQTDPAAAAAALAQLSDPKVINTIVPLLASDWAGQDIQAAMKWAQSLPADNAAVRNSAFSNVLNLWTFNDPAGAATYIQQNLATDPSFSTLAAQVVNTWGRDDPQAAFTWAQSLPPGDGQNSAVLAAMTQLAKIDPQTAWNNVQRLADSNVGQAQVNVIAVWAKQQPIQAAAALQSLTPGDNLNTATADVAKSWLSQDRTAATQWIGTLPEGSARDSAVTQLISTVGKNDPATAFNWATSLGNETTRNTQVVKLAGQWSSINPAAAAAAAQNALGNLANLTPAQQTALEKVVGKGSAP